MALSKTTATILFAVVFGIAGLVYLSSGKAATSTVSFVPASGSIDRCIEKTRDTSAYQQQIVKFTTCYPVVSLDETGKTIPDTEYAYPSNAIFMSPNGNDSNSGTIQSPVKTLARSISLVSDGGTIVARGGTYRDWYSNNDRVSIVTKGFSLQAYPHESPWFDGSDHIVGNRWTSAGSGRWAMKWETPSFCDGKYYDFPYDNQSKTGNLVGSSGRTYSSNTGPCSHWDMYGNDTETAASGDPQSVFVNGVRMKQVNSLTAAVDGKFYYDWDARTMYISSNPSTSTVELSARPVAMVLGGSSTSKRSIKGVGFRRYATNEYENLTAAALYFGGSASAVVENSVFTQNAGRGLLMGTENSVMKDSVFSYNGFNGTHYYGNATTTKVPDNFVLEDSVIANNNLEKMGENCSLSCAQAGIKMSAVLGYTIRNNIFKDNYFATGAWCDTNCYDGAFVNNLLINNEDGYHYEQNDRAIIAGNVFINHRYAINVSSQGAKIYNNTILNGDSTVIAMRIYDDNRSRTTDNIEIGNNVIYGRSTNTNWINGRYGGTTYAEPKAMLGYMDFNSYWRPTTNTNWRMIGAKDEYFSTKSALRAAYPEYEANAVDVVGGNDPFFVDRANGNYTIRSDSSAYRSGGPIPSDVAQAMGVSTASGQSRGSLGAPSNR